MKEVKYEKVDSNSGSSYDSSDDIDQSDENSSSSYTSSGQEKIVKTRKRKKTKKNNLVARIRYPTRSNIGEINIVRDDQSGEINLPAGSVLFIQPSIFFCTKSVTKPIPNSMDFINHIKPLFGGGCWAIDKNTEQMTAFGNIYNYLITEYGIQCLTYSRYATYDMKSVRRTWFTMPKMRDKVPGGLYVYLTANDMTTKPGAFDIIIDVVNFLVVTPTGDLYPDFNKIRNQIFEETVNLPVV